MRTLDIAEGVIKKVILTINSAVALFFLLTGTPHAQARPRPPMPPIPETQQLNSWRFDNTNLLIAGASSLVLHDLSLIESWSGYALSMEGAEAKLFAIPAVDGNGKTNLASTAGTIRFWFKPSWSSLSLGGNGPGGAGRLFEVGSWTEQQSVGWWSLQFNQSGNALSFVAQSRGECLDILTVPIHWLAGDWHQVAFSYSPNGSWLFLDGQLAAQGSSVALVPLEKTKGVLGLFLGGDAQGLNLAQGQFDEVATFKTVPTTDYMAWSYSSQAGTAALGPITPEEDAARMADLATLRAVRANEKMLRATAVSLDATTELGLNEFTMNSLSGTSLGFCAGDWVGLTNLTKSGTNLALTVINPTAGARYDLLTTTNLDSIWKALIQGTEGQTVFVFPLPPYTQSFFRVLAPAQVVVPGDNYAEGQEDTRLYLDGLKLVGFCPSAGDPRMTLSVSRGTLRLATTNGLTFLSGSNNATHMDVVGPVSNLNSSLTNLSYLGASNFFGWDVISLTVSNPMNFQHISSSMLLIINSVNDAPVAVDDEYEVEQNSYLLVASTLGVLVNDKDVEQNQYQLTAYLERSASTNGQPGAVIQPAHGYVDFHSDGSFHYQPTYGYSGPDSFRYYASDGMSTSALATVSIHVRPDPGALTINILSPTNGQLFPPGTNVTMRIDVSGASGIYARLDGTNQLDCSSSGITELSLTGLASGSHSIYVAIWNLNESISEWVTFVIDSDCDGDGVGDAIDPYPCDYYDSALANLFILSGNDQSAAPSAVLPDSLQVLVLSREGIPLRNAPVTFTAASGQGWFIDQSSGADVTQSVIRTDPSGIASVDFRLPSTANTLCLISASTDSAGQTNTIVLAASSSSGGPASATLEVYTPLQ